MPRRNRRPSQDKPAPKKEPVGPKRGENPLKKDSLLSAGSSRLSIEGTALPLSGWLTQKVLIGWKELYVQVKRGRLVIRKSANKNEVPRAIITMNHDTKIFPFEHARATRDCKNYLKKHPHGLEIRNGNDLTQFAFSSSAMKELWRQSFEYACQAEDEALPLTRSTEGPAPESTGHRSPREQERSSPRTQDRSSPREQARSSPGAERSSPRAERSSPRAERNSPRAERSSLREKWNGSTSVQRKEPREEVSTAREPEAPSTGEHRASAEEDLSNINTETDAGQLFDTKTTQPHVLRGQPRIFNRSSLMQPPVNMSMQRGSYGVPQGALVLPFPSARRSTSLMPTPRVSYSLNNPSIRYHRGSRDLWSDPLGSQAPQLYAPSQPPVSSNKPVSEEAPSRNRLPPPKGYRHRGSADPIIPQQYTIREPPVQGPTRGMVASFMQTPQRGSLMQQTFGASMLQPPAQGAPMLAPPAQGASMLQPPAQRASMLQPPAQRASMMLPPRRSFISQQTYSHQRFYSQPPQRQEPPQVPMQQLYAAQPHVQQSYASQQQNGSYMQRSSFMQQGGPMHQVTQFHHRQSLHHA